MSEISHKRKGRRRRAGTGRRRASKWPVLIVILLIMAGIGGSLTIFVLYQRRAQEEVQVQVKAQAEEPGPKEPGPKEPEKPKEPPKWEMFTYEEKCRLLKEKYGVVVPDKNLDFAALKAEVNADIYAWIYMPETNVDYPVVQHASDNSYYLDFNLDGTQGFPGCIYTENYNKKDFTDKNTVIYGHNMNDGSMFATLLNYRDRPFFDGHPYIFIYMPEDILVYQIFSAGFFDDSHQLLAYDIEKDEDFMAYLKRITGSADTRNNMDTTVGLTAKSRILSLSTCTNDTPDERYIVQGVWLEVE